MSMTTIEASEYPCPRAPHDDPYNCCGYECPFWVAEYIQDGDYKTFLCSMRLRPGGFGTQPRENLEGCLQRHGVISCAYCGATYGHCAG